jgi:uncharacterized membrane protein
MPELPRELPPELSSEKLRLRFSLKQLFTSPEQAFLTLALVFGILFLVVVPPFQVADEPAHLFRAYQVSDGRLIAERKDNVPGGWLPTSLVKTRSVWDDRIPFRSKEKVKGDQFPRSFNIPLDREQRSYVDFMSSAYSPVPYLPQVIGISIGKLFNLSPIWLLYLGRLTNLLVTICITVLAIKTIPGYKWVFFLLALTPMAVNQRSSLSADALVNSVAFLIIATIVHYACNLEKPQIPPRDIGLIAVSAVVLALSKQVYFLLPFLCFMIPQSKFGTPQRYWRSCLLIVSLSVISWVAWSLTMKNLVGVPVNPQIDASVERQTQFLLANPLELISIAWNSLQAVEPVLREFIGVLGWLDTRLPTIITISYQHILVLVALVSSQADFVISAARKRLIFLVFMGTVFLVYLSQYIIWAPVGATVVDGVQGRYLIPVAPLFFLLLDNQRFSLKLSSTAFGAAIVYFSLFALTGSWLAAIGRFY